jgi:hypothetical protein
MSSDASLGIAATNRTGIVVRPNVRHERRAKRRDAAFGTSARWRGQATCSFGRPLRVRPAAHALWDLQLLGDEKAPNGQFVDFQPSDAGATDCQSSNGKRTDCYCADCNCPKRKAACRKCPGCKRTESPWGSAFRLQSAGGREPWCHTSRGVSWTQSVGRCHNSTRVSRGHGCSSRTRAKPMPGPNSVAPDCPSVSLTRARVRTTVRAAPFATVVQTSRRMRPNLPKRIAGCSPV